MSVLKLLALKQESPISPVQLIRATIAWNLAKEWLSTPGKQGDSLHPLQWDSVHLV
jgi:hypothetical protein